MNDKSEMPEGGAAETTEQPVVSQDIMDSILDETVKDNVKKAGRVKTHQVEQFEREIETFVTQTFQKHIQYTEDLEQALDAEIARLDKMLTDQLNLVLHDPGFQKVESTWRGLHYLVHQSETGENMKLRVLDVSKKDLLEDLSKASDYDQSGLFKLVYENEFGMPGGQPYGALVGDYEFGNNDPDLMLLEKISEVAQAAHAPFTGGVDPSMLGMDSFEELMDPRELTTRFEGPEYARWRSFRKRPESVYVGLALPRTLGRLPYGETTDPVEAFNFNEDVGKSHDDYLWTNAAWAFGSRLTDSFAQHGWCTAITGSQSGGRVAGLPVHVAKADDGTMVAKCPTEIGITERRNGELDECGFLPLSHYKNTDYAVFFAAQSANKPDKYDDDWASANAELMAKLPYVFAVSRFAHYLKVMQREKLGTYREKSEIERELQNWIAKYVLENPETAGQEQKARRPLAAAKVEVFDVPGKPGHFNARFLLRPHFMLQKIDVSLRLVSSLDQPQ